MKPIVAVVDRCSLARAIDIIGGIDDLNTSQRKLVVKVGIYNTDTGICSTENTLNQIAKIFDNVPEILITESDSYAGPGLKRLEVWRDCYNDRVAPFSLSDDHETKIVEVAGENVPLSHILFESNTFISTHVPRRYEDAGNEDLMNLGSIIKNLLGLIPDKKKFRFHKQLPTALLDMYEAIGGIDLAILDGTHVFLGWKKKKTTVSPNLLFVGRDALAVEAAGAYLVGFDPTEMPVLQEAKKRGLGEIEIHKINIVGDVETTRTMIIDEFNNLKN